MSPEPLEGTVKIARNVPNMRFKIAMTLLFTALSFVAAGYATDANVHTYSQT